MSITSINASLLSSFYDVKYGLTSEASGSGSSSSTSSLSNLVPPWQSTSTAPQQSALVSSVLNGAKFFNPSAAQLTAPKVANANDYKNLFALYQGVNALQGLAAAAGGTTLTSAQQQYAAAFTSGMTQLQTFLGQTGFAALNVAEGTLTAASTTTEGAPQETDTYTTRTIFSGGQNDPVPAFQGSVQFSMTLTNTKGVANTVSFNLADMGSTPRTMGNVVEYLNGQLKAAGATTRFADVATAGVPLTTTVNGQTVSLSKATTNYALEIKGAPTEKVAFSAATTAPAVYLTSASGTPAKAASGTAAATTGDQTQQLMKFNASTTNPQQALVSNTAMQSAVSSALASAAAPDGSVYVLSNVDGTTADGQTIKGPQDVALMKYDSAGNLVYTRTLGAQGGASGYALAVSADGSKVAVAGSITGALDANDSGESATSTNSFVTEYNAEGDEQWTNTQPSAASDVATGVAFGADGSVYAVGTTQAALPKGGGEIGGQDAYVRGYSATGAMTSTVQYGTKGADTPGGITVSGHSVYVAGSENGDAVVRQFNIGAGDTLTAGAVRDLGALQGGNVAGIGVSATGAIVVGGSTHNGDLGGATVQGAYRSGRQGFVATLSPGLTASSADTISYLQTSGDFTATAMTMSGGEAYLAGKAAIAAPKGSGVTSAADGYAAAIDIATGQTTWSQEFRGADYQAQPTSIAVSATGASVLDQLGLPTSVDYSRSTLLVDNTSLRPGDSFYVQTGSGAAQKVTISATDTLQTLAQTIQRLTGFNATAATKTVNGETQLSITPANSYSTITLSSGPAGSDALSGLGLSPGEITAAAATSASSSKGAKVNLGLHLTSTLNLNSTAAIKQAQSALQLAAAKIEVAYQSLVNPPSSSAPAASTANLTYINARTANYQLALSRLTGASS